MEVLERLTSLPSQAQRHVRPVQLRLPRLRAGARRPHALLPDRRADLRRRQAGARQGSTGKGEAKGEEDLHLVTYDIPTAKYTDHGAIFFANGERPAYVNSIAVGKDGTVYTLWRITENGRTRTDLIAIPSPL